MDRSKAAKKTVIKKFAQLALSPYSHKEAPLRSHLKFNYSSLSFIYSKPQKPSYSFIQIFMAINTLNVKVTTKHKKAFNANRFVCL